MNRLKDTLTNKCLLIIQRIKIRQKRSFNILCGAVVKVGIPTPKVSESAAHILKYTITYQLKLIPLTYISDMESIYVF